MAAGSAGAPGDFAPSAAGLTLTADQLRNQLQATLRDFTAEEFAALDAAGQMDWRFVEGQKRYIYRAAETLVATHPDLAARQLDPPVPERSWDRF